MQKEVPGIRPYGLLRTWKWMFPSSLCRTSWLLCWLHHIVNKETGRTRSIFGQLSGNPRPCWVMLTCLQIGRGVSCKEGRANWWQLLPGLMTQPAPERAKQDGNQGGSPTHMHTPIKNTGWEPHDYYSQLLLPDQSHVHQKIPRLPWKAHLF